MLPPRKNEIVAGVVTYDPDLVRLEECLASISGQVERIFVFDNGSKDAEAVWTFVSHFKSALCVPSPGENKGMAYALNSLAAEAIARGYRAMLFMDQDSVARSDMVAEEALCLLAGVGIVSPLIVDRNEVVRTGDENVAVDDDVCEIPRAITSGALVNLAAFEQVGGCDERLFVDWVDFELCDNLKDHGFKILCAPRATLLHEIGKKELAATFVVPTPHGFRRHDVYRTNHSRERRRDKARSQAITIAKYGAHTPIGRDESKIFRKEFVKGVVFERRRAELVEETLSGYAEGIETAQAEKANYAQGVGHNGVPWMAQSVQCFDAGGGKTVWRFACDGPQDAAAAIMLDAQGKRVAVTFVDVGAIDGSWRMSATIADSCDAFDVLVRDALVYRVTPGVTRTLTEYRNSQMVNPGITRAYQVFALMRAAASRVSLPVKVGSDAPLVSLIMPLYHTPANYLRAAVGSVCSQTYGEWELVLVNATPEDAEMRKVLDGLRDERIREIKLGKNLGIAGNTNQGIAQARGDYVAFLDHDDMLDPHALEAYAQRIAQNSELDLLYCDEDNFRKSTTDCFMPIFKPELNLDLLLSHNYIVHFLMVSRRVIEAVPRSGDALSGAQDYDLTLRALDYSGRCARIPQVLYHWRAHEGSTNGGEQGAKPYASDACVEVLKRYFGRHGLKPDIECTHVPYHYRVLHHAQPGDAVTVVLWGGTEQTRARRAQALCASENALIVETLCLSGTFCDVFREVTRIAKGTHMVFIGANVEGVSFRAIDLLVGYSHVPGAGLIASKMLYADGLVAHAGLVVQDDGLVPVNQNFTDHMGGGYLGMAECSCSYSAVWPDCFAIRRELAAAMAPRLIGLAQPLLSMADLCFAVRDSGHRVVVIPDEPVRYRASGDCHYDSDGGIDWFALWNAWGNEWKCDVNFNPCVECSSGYPRFKEDAEGATAAWRALRVARKLKRKIGR